VARTIVVDDALAGLRLRSLRDAATPPARFREDARALGMLLAREALRELPTRRCEVDGPLGRAVVAVPDAEVVAVPVLRAGLGLLPGVHDLVPDASVGMIGLERDPETLEARRYYGKVPDLDGAWVLLLEPMLATGGSAADALAELDLSRRRQGRRGGRGRHRAGHRTGPRAPRRGRGHRRDRRGLDDNGYIVPGLGDFGDRVLGTPTHPPRRRRRARGSPLAEGGTRRRRRRRWGVVVLQLAVAAAVVQQRLVGVALGQATTSPSTSRWSPPSWMA
jgi:uracil phosphoribosyltransferase